MNQTNKNGMWLRQIEPRQENDYNWVINTFLSIMAISVVLIGIINTTGFGELYSPWPMVGTSIALCIAYGITQKIKKEKLFYPVVLLILIVLIVLAGQLLSNGFCLAWNQLGDTYTASKGIVIPAFDILDGKETGALLAFSIFAGIMVGLICVTLIIFKKTVAAILTLICIFGIMLLFDRPCSLLYMTAVLMVSLFLLLCDGNKKEHNHLTASLNRIIPAALISFILIICTLIPAVIDWADDVSEDVREKLHILRYETEYKVLPEGNLVDFESNNTDKAVLVVNMANPEPMYLRGFTGAVYENGVWTSLDKKVLADNEELLYWMNQNHYNPQTQYEAALKIVESDKNKEKDLNTVSITNINGCSKYMYVPYNLCCGDYLKTEDISSDGVVSEGERTYMYSLQPGGIQNIVRIIDALNDSQDETVQAYKKVESAYREFVYNNYLQIPEDVREKLQPEWDKHASSYGKIDELSSYEIQECIMTFLEKIDGDIFDYATVATLTMRYYGIPARYVEGFVISQDMLDEQEDAASINIDGNSGSAWVEVYQDGIGWLPQNITLGINEGENQTENPEQNEKPIEKPVPNEELQQEAEQELEEPVPEGGYMVTIAKSIPFKIIFGILAIILLILTIILRRLLLLNKRKKYLEKQSPKDAVALIFADTVKLLKKLGFERGKGSMMELYDDIKQRFDDSYANEYANMVHLNSRALFSSRQMNDEELKPAEAFYDSTLQLLKDNSKWHSKMWMQWILCLY